MPALIQIRSVQRDRPARRTTAFGKRAIGAGRHFPGIEVFSNTSSDLFAAVKTGSGVTALADAGTTLVTFECLRAEWKGNPHTRTQTTRGWHHHIGKSPVTTNDMTGIGQGFMLNRKVNTDMSAGCFRADPGIVDLSGQIKGVAATHPVDFRQTGFGPPGIQLAGLNLPPLETERITAPTQFARKPP
ncbi:hypothetical protein [Ruegeria atlantica]|uniref:hypothetical protein n=1 Tax=Ruegeria atlantica TaxID=81569 RepID=UPI00147E836D|nr:hypothetical protein [Ruegeria atlantica]